MEQRNNLVLQGTETFSRGQLDNVALDNGSVVLDSVAGRYLQYGSYTTPEFAMPAFCNLNVSWNAHAPQNTMVEVRCRVYAGGSWTGWMSFGKWAPDYPRASISTHSDDGLIFLMGDTVTVAARAAAMSGLKFDSRGEYEYYVGTVVPKIGRGEIVKWEAHPCFLLFPAGEYNGVKLRSVQYTADFRLTYADGTVEIVEVKSKFVRRMQRDYPVRRRVFLELIARPAGWKFTEIITADSKEEIKRWRELAEEVSSCGKNG